MSADPSKPSRGTPPSAPAEEKIRKFCFELALALRRITGRKIDRGLKELPQVIREAITNANAAEEKDQPGQSED